jgi:multidrug efflux pump subunit AcrB
MAGDVAEISFGAAVGQYDRYNQQRMVTIIGNVAGADLGSAARETQAAIERAGEAPRGVRVDIRGQVPPMRQTQSGLQLGLLLTVVVIVLLLVANFQSLRAAPAILSMIPAVVMGVAVALWITGATLNAQSFMGAIMAIGVSVANAILLVTFAEQRRREGLEAGAAAIQGAESRLRPILMTSLAMIAGMIPMALGDRRRRRTDRSIGQRRGRRPGGFDNRGVDRIAAGVRNRATQGESRIGFVASR